MHEAARGMLRMSSAVNIVGDGNSLMVGTGSTGSNDMLRQVINNRAPCKDSGVTYSNVAIAGQTWRQMNGLDSGSATDVDAAWIAGRTNVLLLWESTNSIHFGRTAAQCQADAAAYIAARKAANPWRVVLLTTLPRFELGSPSGVNTDPINRAWNALAKASYRDLGADILVDVRNPGGPFNFDGETAANFTATQGLWAETSQWVHLSNAGYAVIADYVASALRRLPSKAP